MALFAYSFLNNHRIFLHSIAYPSAILNVPLRRFKKTPGCTSFKQKKLQIGKIYNVRILDPMEMGRCVFRGIGISKIPKSKFNDELRNSFARIGRNFLVFEKTKGKKKCIFVVDPYHCTATPI